LVFPLLGHFKEAHYAYFLNMRSRFSNINTSLNIQIGIYVCQNLSAI
jgi:hypothetical protein